MDDSGYVTLGEEITAAYFTEHGVPFCFEPPWREVFGIDVDVNPDFLVDPAGVRAVLEVKQFETTRLADRLVGRSGVMTLAEKDVYGPIRWQITQPAREQLLPFAGLGVPLVVGLTNPLVPHIQLDTFHMTHAILGNPKYTFRVGPDGPGEGNMLAEDYGAFISITGTDEDRRLVNHHPHIYAVVVIHEREVAADWRTAVLAEVVPKPSPDAGHHERVAHMIRVKDALDRPQPEGAYRWASVYDLSGNPTPPGFQGTPLPRTLFSGPRDKWFGFTAEGFGPLEPES
jgi:hypothetical protein